MKDDKRRRVYVLPIRGEIGYDAHERLIQKMWNNAKDLGVQTLVLEFDCQNGMPDLEEYRDLLEEIKDEAADSEIQVVVWIKEALGAATAYALMFPDIYFYKDGVMGGGQSIDISLKLSFKDPQVQAKMISAWLGILRGMAEEGGHDAVLCEAAQCF